MEEIYINYSRHHHCFYLELGYLVFKTSLFFRNAHVRMAERSKAPDSRVELFLTGVFWSTNVGVGSNPTSDKCFQISKNKRLFRAISAEKSERFVALISKIAYCSVSIVKWTSSWKSGLENRGIDPRTSRMLSERSTIWASSPFDFGCLQIGGILRVTPISFHSNKIHTRLNFLGKKTPGGPGYRSPCLSNANRALYHLS